ncbi:MAG: YlbF family regulator [Lachnospiraceae bacterium]
MEENKKKSYDFTNYFRGIEMSMNEAIMLNQSIRQSKEYKKYCDTLAKLKENKELYDALNSFRRRNYELQSYDDNINRYHEIHNLALEYEKVLKNPDVNAFLVAEQIFSRKMQDVYEKIAEGIELDYEYMN